MPRIPLVDLTVDATSRGPVFAAPWRRGMACDAVSGAECVVSHTVFRYERWRDLPRIGAAAERAARLFAGQPGAVLLQQWFLPGRRLMGDLSVWRAEDDLRAFLVLPEHVALVSAWRGRMHGVHHAWTAPPDRAAIWRRAKPLMG